MTTLHLLVSLGQFIGSNCKSLRLCNLTKALKAKRHEQGRRARTRSLSAATYEGKLRMSSNNHKHQRHYVSTTTGLIGALGISPTHFYRLRALPSAPVPTKSGQFSVAR